MSGCQLLLTADSVQYVSHCEGGVRVACGAAGAAGAAVRPVRVEDGGSAREAGRSATLCVRLGGPSALWVHDTLVMIGRCGHGPGGLV